MYSESTPAKWLFLNKKPHPRLNATIGLLWFRCRLAALDHRAQLRGDSGEPLAGGGIGAVSAREVDLQFSRQNGAAREAEGAQHAGKFVRGGRTRLHGGMR